MGWRDSLVKIALLGWPRQVRRPGVSPPRSRRRRPRWREARSELACRTGRAARVQSMVAVRGRPWSAGLDYSSHGADLEPYRGHLRAERGVTDRSEQHRGPRNAVGCGPRVGRPSVSRVHSKMNAPDGRQIGPPHQAPPPALRFPGGLRRSLTRSETNTRNPPQTHTKAISEMATTRLRSPSHTSAMSTSPALPSSRTSWPSRKRRDPQMISSGC